MALGYGPIHKLTAAECVESFDCGQPALNQFLKRYALVNQRAGGANSYVCCVGQEVVGFYSLAAGSVEPKTAPLRVVKGLSRHPVPVMVLARLAVDKSYQGMGLGIALIKDALLRTLQVSDIIGIRALIVHAKDDIIRDWYMQWEFEPSPTNRLHLFLLIKDIKDLVG
ncbi:MAG: GNAT family N-acetyltransferase [Pseudomonadota bacterium]